MLWRWLRRFFVVDEPKVVYVPIGRADSRPLRVRWGDPDYLREVASMAHNSVWVCELADSLKIMRDYADAATTPDELKGITRCISEMKALVTAPARAGDTLSAIRAIEKDMESVI